MGSTHKTIYMPDLQSLRIPLPPLAEQREIVTKIRNSNQKTDLLIDKLGKQMELLEERRRVLIATMVSGRDAAYCSQVSQRRSA
jgi:type I restriction enzyme S subunit